MRGIEIDMIDRNATDAKQKEFKTARIYANLELF